MLYLDNPVGTLHGVMVYRDHANPNLFYYHSERPRISRTVLGTPELQLIKYRRDITDNPAFDSTQAQSLGGGLFNFTVDLGVDASVLARVRGDLQRRAPGEVNLSPIPFKGGSVRLSTTKTGEETGPASGFSFFEEVLGASTPTLVGDNRSIFSVVLSQEGATLVEQALQSRLSPVGVIYELTALALRPAFQVKLTAEYSRVYEHFESEMGLRTRVGRIAAAVEIGEAYEKLVESGHVHVDVLEFTDDADHALRSKAALDWFKTEITAQFFKAVLTPPSTAAGGAFTRLNGLFTALQNGQAGAPPTPPLAATPPVASETAEPPKGLSSGVLTTTQINQAARAMSSTSTDFVQTAFSLRHFRQEELRLQVFDFRLQQAVSWSFGAQGMLSTLTRGLDARKVVQVVDLDDEFFTRMRVDVSLASDLTKLGVAALTVNLEYPADRAAGTPPLHHDGWVFRPGDTTTHQFQCWLNDAKNQAYRYQLEVVFAPDSEWQGVTSGAKSPWLVSTARQLTINPLDGLGVMEVRVLSSLQGKAVSQAQVELRYEVEGSPPLAELFIIKPGDPSPTWKIRLSAATARTVKARVSYTLAEGRSIEGDWTETTDGIIVVPDPLPERLRVRVLPQLVAAELVEALLVLRYSDTARGYTVEEQLSFTPNVLAAQNVSIPIFEGGPREYSWSLTVVKSTGLVINSSGVEMNAVLVLKE